MKNSVPGKKFAQLLRRATIRKLEAKGILYFLHHLLLSKSPPKKAPPLKRKLKPVDPEKMSIAGISRQACIGCGLCSSVCKENAVSMTRDETGFVPQLNEEKCNRCNLCYRVCPGINIREYPGELGEIKTMIVGHARDPEVRYSASSGGICRSILTALLEQKIVDKVIITRATDDPFQPETIITSSLKDLSGNRPNSIYSPTTPLSALKDLDKNLKYAFVGLPCHIAGLSLTPSLKKMIYVTVGIFCSHTPTFGFVETFLRDLSSKNDVKSLRYRGDGWPGKSTIYFKDGDVHSMNFLAMWYTYNNKKAYQQPRCSTCTYYSAEFADIAIGDPWILAKKDRKGSSLVFIRSDRGEDVMAASNYLITFDKVAPEMEEPILEFHKESVALKQKNR